MHIKLNDLDMMTFRVIENLRDNGHLEQAEHGASRWLESSQPNEGTKQARHAALAALGLEIRYTVAGLALRRFCVV